MVCTSGTFTHGARVMHGYPIRGFTRTRTRTCGSRCGYRWVRVRELPILSRGFTRPRESIQHSATRFVPFSCSCWCSAPNITVLECYSFELLDYRYQHDGKCCVQCKRFTHPTMAAIPWSFSCSIGCDPCASSVQQSHKYMYAYCTEHEKML